MEQNGQTKIDIAKLQVQVTTLKDDVKTIKDNHLPHIYESLSEMGGNIKDLKGDMKLYIGIGMGALGLLNILISIFHPK